MTLPWSALWSATGREDRHKAGLYSPDAKGCVVTGSAEDLALCARVEC